MPRDPLIVGRIPRDLEARVDQECARLGVSKSELLRAALTGHLLLLSTTPHPTPKVPAGGRTRSPTHPGNLKAGLCEHRIRIGAYCRACDRVVP